VEADSLQKLIMKFTLKDKSTGKLMTVHQAFVKLHNLATNQEIIFVAEPDSAKIYKFDIVSNACGCICKPLFLSFSFSFSF
jgi:hypothetical protein